MFLERHAISVLQPERFDFGMVLIKLGLQVSRFIMAGRVTLWSSAHEEYHRQYPHPTVLTKITHPVQPVVVPRRQLRVYGYLSGSDPCLDEETSVHKESSSSERCS